MSPPLAIWLHRVRLRMMSRSGSGPAAALAGVAAKRICTVCGDAVAPSACVVLPAPCSHAYCPDCFHQFVDMRCKDAGLFPPRCCRARVPLSPSVAKALGPELAQRLLDMTVEYDDHDKTYCANAACSAYLRQPAGSSSGTTTKNAQARCKACKTRTCRRCKYRWHDGTCTRSLADDQARTTAVLNGWRECYKCKNMVERSGGCDHMT